MNNKKLLAIILTISFIAISGVVYSLQWNKKAESKIILESNDITEVAHGNSEITDDTDKPNDLKESVETNSESTKDSDTSDELAENIDSLDKYQEEKQPLMNKKLYIHICGQVIKEDVYEVSEGSRVIDVIRLAGGLTKQAAGAYVNQAQEVLDGQRIYIPSLKEIEEDKLSFENKLNLGDYRSLTDPISSVIDEGSKTVANNSNASNLVNINTASMNELMTLTGIGEAKAKSIIAYRETKGYFKDISEIKKIEGIKDGVFNKISDLITIN